MSKKRHAAHRTLIVQPEDTVLPVLELDDVRHAFAWRSSSSPSSSRGSSRASLTPTDVGWRCASC